MTNKRQEIANKIFGIAERCAMTGGDPLEATADWHIAEQRKLLEECFDEYLNFDNEEFGEWVDNKLQELNK